MTRLFFAVVVSCLAYGIAAAQEPPRTAEKIGEKIDRGISQIGTELSQGWAELRKSVDKIGVQGRVYGRLRWDKALADAALDVDVRDSNVVILKGSVPNAAAKLKAVQLARDTVGVNSVVDELTVAAGKASQ